MIPQDLTFEWPHASFLLVVMLLFPFLAWFLYNYRKNALNAFGDPSLLQEILVPRSTATFIVKSFSLCVIWVLCVIALMQPKGNAHYPEEELPNHAKKRPESHEVNIRRRAHDVIFLVDASASMSVDDTRVHTSRLDYAKEIADQIASRLNGEAASLYAFTSEVIQMSPATYDYLFVRLMLRDIQINEGDTSGTSLFEALASMRDRYFKAPTPRLKTLIILSDGGDTRIEDEKGTARQQDINNLLSFLGDPAALNLRVYTIGLGSIQGTNIPHLTYEGKSVHTSLQEDIMQQIAKRGRGEYFNANNFTAIDMAQQIIQDMKKDPPFLEEATLMRSFGAMAGSNKIYTLYYQIPLGMALVLLAYILVWPNLERKLNAETQRRGENAENR